MDVAVVLICLLNPKRLRGRRHGGVSLCDL